MKIKANPHKQKIPTKPPLTFLQLILLQAALFALHKLFEEEYAPRPIFVSNLYNI